MSYRNRSACHNLSFKQRNNTTITSQYITKTYCYKFRIIMPIVSLNDHFTDSLGSSHNIGRIHSLICGDHNKLLNTILYCCLRCLPGTKYIILNRFIRAVLHKRYVLMRSRMVNDIRMIFLHDIIHAVCITNRSNQHYKIKIRVLIL